MSDKVKYIRKTKTRESLIQAFMELITIGDFDKITINTLTEKAKVNRATFYSHFQDKFELLDEVIGESAEFLIEKYTNDRIAFESETIKQLVFAVFQYHQQVKDKCKRSYATVMPLLRTQMLVALNGYFEVCLIDLYEPSEHAFYVNMFSTMIYEAAYLWGIEKITLSQEEIAMKVSRMIFFENI